MKPTPKKRVRVKASRKKKTAPLKEMIKQVEGEFCIFSEDGETSLECFATEEEANAKLYGTDIDQIESIVQEQAPAITTQPDPVDGHIHEVTDLDEEGNGSTSEAGEPVHAHEVVAFEVQPYESEGYISEHPGELVKAEEEPAPSEEPAPEEAPATESLIPFSKHKGIISRFGEAGPKDSAGSIWDVILIEEGMSKNGRLYTAEVLKDAHERKVFEGIPAFAFVYRTEDGLVLDHAPDGLDTTNFPKDVAGFYKNVRFEETSGGKMGLIGEFHFVDDTLRKKHLAAFKAGNKALFGLSIDAIGEGEQLSPDTVEIKYIVRANSDDLVSFPAAGGRFIRMVASVAKKHRKITEGKPMEGKDALIEIINQVNPASLEGKNLADITLEELKGIVQGTEFDSVRSTLAELLGVGTSSPADSSHPEVSTPTAPASSEVAMANLVNESVKKALAPMKAKAHKTSVESAIKEAGLEGHAAELVRERAGQKVGDVKHLTESIHRVQKIVEGAGWNDPKITEATVTDAKEDKWTRAIEGAMAGRPQKGTPPFKSLRHMVGVVCGDVNPTPQKQLQIANALMGGVVARYSEWRDSENCAGLTESYNRRLNESARKRFSLKEAINLAQLATIFGEGVNRSLIADYELPQMNDWRSITSKIGFVDDTRVQRPQQLGYYGDLATVAEGAAYVQITSLTDQEITLSLTKYGNFESLTMEAILRNDLGWFAKVPQRLAQAANQKVRKTVWAHLVSNSAIYDSVVLFHSGSHANTDTNTLSVTNLGTARAAMRAQTTYGSTNNELGLSNIPKFLIVPPELEDTGNSITASQFEPTSNLYQVANMHKGLALIVLDHMTDADSYMLVADPANTPTIEVDFVGNSDAPELFTQDDPTQGASFDEDEVKVKVRTWFGSAVLDWRGFYAGIPS
jgi:hypothetical protein